MLWSQDGDKMILSGLILAGIIALVRYLYNKFF